MTIQSTYSNTLPKNPYLSPPSHIKEVPDLIKIVAMYLPPQDQVSFSTTSKIHRITIGPLIISLNELKDFIKKLKTYIENNKIQYATYTFYKIASNLNSILAKLTEAEKNLESTYPLNLSIYATKSPISNEESLTSEVINALSYLYPEDIEKLKKNIRAPSFAKRFFPILKICTQTHIPANNYASFPMDFPIYLGEFFWGECVRDFLHEKDLHRALEIKSGDRVIRVLSSIWTEDLNQSREIALSLNNSGMLLLKDISLAFIKMDYFKIGFKIIECINDPNLRNESYQDALKYIVTIL